MKSSCSAVIALWATGLFVSAYFGFLEPELQAQNAGDCPAPATWNEHALGSACFNDAESYVCNLTCSPCTGPNICYYDPATDNSGKTTIGRTEDKYALYGLACQIRLSWNSRCWMCQYSKSGNMGFVCLTGSLYYNPAPNPVPATCTTGQYCQTYACGWYKWLQQDACTCNNG